MQRSIRPGAGLAPEVRRIAGADIERVLADLEVSGPERHQAIHKARKGFKRLRGLLRLIRPASPTFHAKQNRRLRNAARALSGPRSLTATIETLDRLEPESGSNRFTSVRAALADERASVELGAAETDQSGLEQALWLARGKTLAAGDGFAGLHLVPATDPAPLLAAGMAQTYGRARKALKAARRTGAVGAFHELRKQSKYHMTHLALLARFPAGGEKRRDKVKTLTARLGDLHDVDMLMARLNGDAPPEADPEELAALRKRLTGERKRLARQVVKLARPLYRKAQAPYRARLQKRLAKVRRARK